MGQEIVAATFAAVDTANLTNKFITITLSKCQANYALGVTIMVTVNYGIID